MIKGSEKILIIKLSSIGDVVHTIPFVEVLKSNYPKITIDWCVDKEISPIIYENPYISRVVISKRNKWKKGLAYPSKWPEITKEVYLLFKELRKKRYDIIIDLQGLLKSGIIAGACKGKRKIGLDGAREYGWLFVNEIVPVDYNQHAIDRYLQIATYLGCKSLDWKWKLFISEREKQLVDNIVSKINEKRLPIVGINPICFS
jgi:ADP-heptose:LPS heptosyltransferase